ncbi:hypothetical protein AT251_16555 [Enterovibrio nigricans]|nr:hypothetical protein [Enterovibrio nigricans]PKF49746.1 hypothetical protein AT251_16555 [Enterovibrio nigricans]
MSVVFRLIKSWWPNAGSSTLLNLELPVISIIVTVYSYDSLSSYANALAIFMFANAFVFPVTTVIIKEGTGIITRRYVTNLIFVVFLITNALLVVYGLKYNSSDMLLMHVFSISIVSVGVRRYLHGVVILKEATTIIFPASIFRLIVSTCCCYLLITKGVSSAFAPIVALVLGSWVESLVLLIYVQKKRLNSASGEVSLDRKSVFQVYSSALFIMASALMSNTLITYIINTSNYVSRNDLLEYWAIFFVLYVFLRLQYFIWIISLFDIIEISTGLLIWQNSQVSHFYPLP